MRKMFKRSRLASEAPTFLRVLDGFQHDKGIKCETNDERIMLWFLEKEGFPMGHIGRYGYHVSTDDFGNVVIETK